MEIRGTEYQITGVSSWAVMKWDELNTMIERSEELGEEYDEEATDRRRRREIRQELRGLSKKAYALRLEIIQDILAFNKIDYDQHWWEHAVTVNDTMSFIIGAMTSVMPKAGKKKVTPKSTGENSEQRSTNTPTP